LTSHAGEDTIRGNETEPIACVLESDHPESPDGRRRAHLRLGDALCPPRDFVVADSNGRVIGCGALTIEWDNLAEIKSLAVAKRYQRRGIGRRLIKACLAEARRLGIGQVFALTSSPRFFDHIGFHRVARETLPHKVWSDCVNCPKFPDCDETAVAIQVRRRAKAK
jgi:amino-acid N-acetyltransferase